MSVKLEFSENIQSYRDEINTDLSQIETEINSISLTLDAIPKHQINKIEKLLTDCENNVC